MRIISITLLTLFIVACKPQLTEQNELAQRSSYALGYNIIESAKHLADSSDVAFDRQEFMRGVNDNLNNKQGPSGEDLLKLQLDLEAAVKDHRSMVGAVALKEAEKYLANNIKHKDIEVTKEGVQYRLLQAGSGTTVGSNKMKFAMRGSFIDDSVFDQTTADKPYEFAAADLVPGLAQVVPMMKKGSKWQIFVPPHLAYGEQGARDVIPPNTLVIFEIEIKEIIKDAATKTK